MVEVLQIGLTKEEQARVKKYSDILTGCKGRYDVLTAEEQTDLRALLGKSLVYQGAVTEETMG